MNYKIIIIFFLSLFLISSVNSTQVNESLFFSEKESACVFPCIKEVSTIEDRQKVVFNEFNSKYHSDLEINISEIQKGKKIDFVDIDITIPTNILNSSCNFKNNGLDVRACFKVDFVEKTKTNETLYNLLTQKNKKNVLENKISNQKGYIVNEDVLYYFNIDKDGILEVCISILGLPLFESEIKINKEPLRKNYKKDSKEILTYVLDVPNNLWQKIASIFGSKKELELKFNLSAELSSFDCEIQERENNSSILNYIKDITVTSTNTGKGCNIKFDLDDSNITLEQKKMLIKQNFYPHVLISGSYNNIDETKAYFVYLDNFVNGYRNNALNIFKFYSKNNLNKELFIYKSHDFTNSLEFTVPESVCNNNTNEIDVVLFYPLESNLFLKYLSRVYSWIARLFNKHYKHKDAFDYKYDNVYTAKHGAFDLKDDSSKIIGHNNFYNLEYKFKIPVKKINESIIEETIPKINSFIDEKKFICAKKEVSFEKRLKEKFNVTKDTFCYDGENIVILNIENGHVNIFIDPAYLSKVEQFNETENDARICFKKKLPNNILTELNVNNRLENKTAVLHNNQVISFIDIVDDFLFVNIIRPLHKLDDDKQTFHDQRYEIKNITNVYYKENKSNKNGAVYFSLTTAMSPLSCVPKASVSYLDINFSNTFVDVTETGKGCYVNLALNDEFWTKQRLDNFDKKNFYPHFLITKTNTFTEKNKDYRRFNDFIDEKKTNAFNIFDLTSYNKNPETNFIYKAKEFSTNYNFNLPNSVCDNSSTELDTIAFMPTDSSAFFAFIEKVVGWTVYIFTFTIVDIRDKKYLDYKYDNVYSSTLGLDIGDDSKKLLTEIEKGHTFYNFSKLDKIKVKSNSLDIINSNKPKESEIVDDGKFNCIINQKTIEERLKEKFNEKNTLMVNDPNALDVVISNALNSKVNININPEYLSKVSNFKQNQIDARVCFTKKINISNFKNYDKEYVLVNGNIISKIKILKSNEILVCISRPTFKLNEADKEIYDLKYKSKIKYNGNKLHYSLEHNIENIFNIQEKGVDLFSYIFSLNANLASLDCISAEDAHPTNELFNCNVVPVPSYENRKKVPFNKNTSRFFYFKPNAVSFYDSNEKLNEKDIAIIDINIDKSYLDIAGKFKEDKDARICFVKNLENEIDELNEEDTYVSVKNTKMIGNGLILFELKLLDKKENKIQICISRPTKKLTTAEARIRDLYDPNDYTIKEVKRFLGIDFLAKDKNIKTLYFRINLDLEPLGCKDDKSEIDNVKEAFDCLDNPKSIIERKKIVFSESNTKYYQASGNITFAHSSISETTTNAFFNIVLENEFLSNVNNFYENGIDARLCSIENYANISSKYFISTINYIENKKSITEIGDVFFTLETDKEKREVKLCISRPVRQLTEEESNIKNLQFNDIFTYKQKNYLLGIKFKFFDWLYKDTKLGNLKFIFEELNLPALFCINKYETTHPEMGYKYINAASAEGRCYDPSGFLMNKGFTGEKSYYDFGFNRLILDWNEETMLHNSCDYGMYCDQDQLKISLLQKKEILKTDNKKVLDNVTFVTENSKILKNNILSKDILFKDSVINSLNITDIKNMGVTEYLEAIKSISSTLPFDLKEFIVYRALIEPNANLNKDKVYEYMNLISDNNFIETNNEYYFIVKSQNRAQIVVDDFFIRNITQNEDEALLFLEFYENLINNLDIYFGDVIFPVIVNAKSYSSLQNGLTVNIFENKEFLSNLEPIKISNDSTIKAISVPNSIKISYKNLDPFEIEIQQTDIESILNYYNQSSYNKFKENLLFTNPINAYYYNYQGSLFRNTTTGTYKQTEIISNHDIWSKVQDGFILQMLTKNGHIDNIIYKNIRPIQLISKTNNTYLLQYKNKGDQTNIHTDKMDWYDDTEAKIITTKVINSKHELTGGKMYKTTIFAFVDEPSQYIEILSKNPILKLNEKTLNNYRNITYTDVSEKEHLFIPNKLINDNFKGNDLQTIKSIFSNITSNAVCFNFDDFKLNLWYNPEKALEDEMN